MRYCIGCGNEIGNERFCDKCGTDNGKVYTAPNTGGYRNFKEYGKIRMPGVDAAIILHWAAMVFLLIAAVILLKSTCSSAGNMTAVLLLNPLGLLFVAAYFILGMWSMIPSAAFLLGAGSSSIKKVTGTSVFLMIITIASYVLNAVVLRFPDLPEIVGKISLLFGSYRMDMTYLIFFEVVTIIAGAAGQYLAQRKGKK